MGDRALETEVWERAQDEAGKQVAESGAETEDARDEWLLQHAQGVQAHDESQEMACSLGRLQLL